MIETTVLVVGAGPTGLLLAAELHRRNVACRVIDAHSEPLHWDRATVVHPRSLEVFESLGLVERLLTAGVKQRMARLHSAGSVLGEIDLSICGSRFGFNIGISEEIVEELLNDYLQQQGGAVIRASRLVDLRPADDGMLATIEHDQTTEQVFARWVVGCDGLHSATRTLSGIDLLGHDIPEPWAVFDATVAGWPHSYEGNYAYLDRPPVILTALPNQRWRVYLRPTGPDSDLVADAMGTIGQYLPAVHFDDVAAPTRFHCHTKVAARFRSGRVLLAGDAAHVCSPAQGHGMNTGLQDAFNLAWKLALVCQGSCASSLLDSYEAERRPVAEMVTTSGDAVEDAQRVIDAAERRVRDETIRSVFADPSSRHHEAIAEAELDVDYADSPIVAGDRHDLLCPGQRLPDDIDVRLADGRTCRLHELTNRIGHTALLICSASLGQEERTKIEHAVRAATDPSVIDEIVALATNPADTSSVGQILLPDAGQVGIGEITLLVIRPDGHIGLRADRNQSAAVQAYQALLTTGQA